MNRKILSLNKVQSPLPSDQQHVNGSLIDHHQNLAKIKSYITKSNPARFQNGSHFGERFCSDHFEGVYLSVYTFEVKIIDLNYLSSSQTLIVSGFILKIKQTKKK